MWWLLRAGASAIFLLGVVLSIPIAFDVGGRDAGLAFSLGLFVFYFVYSAARLVLLAPPGGGGGGGGGGYNDNIERGRRGNGGSGSGSGSASGNGGGIGSRACRALAGLLGLAQWLVLPALLIWSLDRFSVDGDGGDGAGWVARTLAPLLATRQPHAATWSEWFFGSHGLLETVALGGWDSLLRYSSPFFQLLEGFCSLLVIQAAGQITRWLVNRGRSDTWVIILLVFSSSVMSSAVYFLWRVARFPQISNQDATLIGITMTSAVFLCAYGIGSGRGNPVESSLLFAYIVLCVYQIFTDYLPSAETAAAAAATPQPEFPPFPPIIMASYSTLLHMLSSLPSAVDSSLQFLYAAFQTVTPSVIISLTYRAIVFYCATRIIPAVRDSGAARALADGPDPWDDGGGSSDGASRALALLGRFAPSILIAVYTSLLLQHFSAAPDGGDDGGVGWTLRGSVDAGSEPWRWINVACTMALYAVELYLGGNGDEGGLTSHWKTD